MRLSFQRRSYAPYWQVFFERDVIAVSAAMFVLAVGENLWKPFLPKYLEALGASASVIGLFGASREIIGACYQYPGGWLSDRYGRRHALMLFVTLAAIGYVVYGASSSWPLVFVGLAFARVWTNMASPTLLAIVGDVLPKERLAGGFATQSAVRRIPTAVAPALGGWAIATYGVKTGVRIGLGATLVLAALALVLISRLRIPARGHVPLPVGGVWQRMPTPLRWLLASDILVRASESLVDMFLILYVVNISQSRVQDYGLLVTIQVVTSIACYLFAGPLAGHVGRKLCVTATFVAFALFPAAIVCAHTFIGLVFAFVISGLREIGEPARIALIVDLASPVARARSIGMYYFVRSLAIAPAALVGGFLWEMSPVAPFWTAAAIGSTGVIVFTAKMPGRIAG